MNADSTMQAGLSGGSAGFSASSDGAVEMQQESGEVTRALNVEVSRAEVEMMIAGAGVNLSLNSGTDTQGISMSIRTITRTQTE